jgi:hypothetical protein
MTKRDERSEAQPCQRLPKGHFDSDGKSQGEQTGAVRKSPDAYQGPRDRGESTPAKPGN